MILKFEQFINEKLIGTFKQKLSISVDLESTKHAQERQERHIDSGGRFITEDEIKKLMSKAVKDITELLMFDKIDIGQKIVIYDKESKLNIACEIKGEIPKLNLVAITVMLTDNFKIGKDQLKLEI
jgi:predicted ABC-type ATPase